MKFNDAICTLERSFSRPLRTSEYILFKSGWNNALREAENQIKEPWGHSTPESVICAELRVDDSGA